MSKARWPTIKALVKARTSTVIQVGAHLGTEMVAFKSLWPESHIWAFEPRVAAFRKLQRAHGHKRNIHLIQSAVSKTQGLTKLYVARLGGVSSLLSINTESKYYQQPYATIATVDVPTVTLDGFCAQKGIKNIDFLMIDVQGGELDVLKGAAELLRRRAVGVIYTEVFFMDLYKDCPQFADVRKYLDDLGYRFVKLFNFGRALGKRPTMWSDALFVKGD